MRPSQMRTSQVPQAERVAQVGREETMLINSAPGGKRLGLPRGYPRVVLRMAYPTTSPCESDSHESENVEDEVRWHEL